MYPGVFLSISETAFAQRLLGQLPQNIEKNANLIALERKKKKEKRKRVFWPVRVISILGCRRAVSNAAA